MGKSVYWAAFLGICLLLPGYAKAEKSEISDGYGYEQEAQEAYASSQRAADEPGLAGILNQQEIKRAVEEEKTKIATMMGSDVKLIEPHLAANQEKNEYAGKHILVFISSSMPKAGIDNLMKILGDRNDVAFVMRGLIGDPSKIKPTQEWIRSVLCPSAPEEEPTRCFKAPIDINPLFFERMEIGEVPAVAYVPDPDATLITCEEREGEFYTFFGDFSPVYALEQIAKTVPEDQTAQAIVESFRQPFHERGNQ